jgi:phosphatidate cytidylyltransferase
MNSFHDPQMRWLLEGILGLLTVSSLIGYGLHRRVRSEAGRKTVDNLNARIRAWWVMCALFAGAVLAGRTGSVILFALVSFQALREFVTLTPTKAGDHRALFWAFFVILPVQYYLVATQWYGLFSVFIPVYAFLFIPIRAALAADCDRFLERTAKIQWGLMVCVFFVSHVPALLMLPIAGFAGQNSKLLLFFAVVVQLSDVLQYVWGKTFGRHKIAPTLSPSKTWEGFIGGVLSATAVGAALWWATPFRPWQAAAFALIICLMGFFGGLVMSAIKRDRGVKDYGNLIEGHGGVMDRIDSICFAAPVFFHLLRYLFT